MISASNGDRSVTRNTSEFKKYEPGRSAQHTYRDIRKRPFSPTRLNDSDEASLDVSGHVPSQETHVESSMPDTPRRNPSRQRNMPAHLKDFHLG